MYREGQREREKKRRMRDRDYKERGSEKGKRDRQGHRANIRRE